MRISFNLRFITLVCVCALFIGPLSFSAQTGPIFPTHRFPTDRSLHVGYKFGYLKSSGNFDSTGAKASLLNEASLSRMRHTLTPEYQPSRQLSFGAYINFDGLQLNDVSGVSTSKNSLSDQAVWSEFRFFDIPGASVGLAAVAKFPLYSNPTVQDLSTTTTTGTTSTSTTNAILMGDGQTDFTIMATAELWPNNSFKISTDFGYTYRADSFAAELPYMIAMGFVTQKVELSARLKGNFSLGNDDLAITDPVAAANSETLQQAFGGSEYALSENPSLSLIEFHGELWFDPRWGIESDFSFPFRGSNSVDFWNVAFGITYRWAEADRAPKRTAREVNIDVDDEKGRFEAEESEFF